MTESATKESRLRKTELEGPACLLAVFKLVEIIFADGELIRARMKISELLGTEAEYVELIGIEAKPYETTGIGFAYPSFTAAKLVEVVIGESGLEVFELSVIEVAGARTPDRMAETGLTEWE